MRIFIILNKGSITHNCFLFFFLFKRKIENLLRAWLGGLDIICSPLRQVVTKTRILNLWFQLEISLASIYAFFCIALFVSCVFILKVCIMSSH